MANPINQRYNESVVLDPSGNGAVDITMRADFVLQNTRWVVQGGTGTNQVTANNFIDSQPWDGTYSGDNDQSGKTRLLPAQTVVTCQWTGGRPGGTATLYLWGIEYPAGEGIPPPSSGDGPGNPIVGGTTLIRDAIQSSNFQTGVSGWEIKRDGSYEFGPGGIIRGGLEVDGADGSKVVITTNAGAAEIDYQPPTNADPTVTDLPGTIRGTTNGVAGASFDTLDIRAPRPLKGAALGAQALVSLHSGSPDGTATSSVILQANAVDFEANQIQKKGIQSYVYQQTIVYTASGTFVKAGFPEAAIARVRMVGGGGGGGGAGATGAGQWSFGDGGGGGEYAEGTIALASMAASETVTVGAGGAQGVGTVIGGSGSITSFGAFITANGGSPGPNRPPTATALLSNSGTGSPGGTGGTGGTFRMPGGIGGRGFGNASTAAGQVGGTGGTSMFSGGTVGVFNTGGFGGSGYGGGGGGGALSASGGTVGGGNGAAGLVLVDLYG